MFNSKPVIVIARLPHGAFGDFRDVPSSQDKTYRKGFGINQLQSALKYANNTAREYREGHGGGAVYSVKIEIGGIVYDRDQIGDIINWANGGSAKTFPKVKINSMADFMRVANAVREIAADVDREMKAESDRLNAEFRAMMAADNQ